MPTSYECDILFIVVLIHHNHLNDVDEVSERPFTGQYSIIYALDLIYSHNSQTLAVVKTMKAIEP